MTRVENIKLNEYVKKQYNVIMKPIHDESDSYYSARVLEFDGCLATGDNFEEAHEAIYEVIEGFIEDMMESGEEIPAPIGDDEFSGNLRVHMLKSLHRDLSHTAKLEGVSLNQYIVSKLSK